MSNATGIPGVDVIGKLLDRILRSESSAMEAVAISAFQRKMNGVTGSDFLAAIAANATGPTHAASAALTEPVSKMIVRMEAMKVANAELTKKLEDYSERLDFSREELEEANFLLRKLGFKASALPAKGWIDRSGDPEWVAFADFECEACATLVLEKGTWMTDYARASDRSVSSVWNWKRSGFAPKAALAQLGLLVRAPKEGTFRWNDANDQMLRSLLHAGAKEKVALKEIARIMSEGANMLVTEPSVKMRIYRLRKRDREAAGIGAAPGKARRRGSFGGA